MKKFRVALLGTASVLCLAMGVAMTNNANYVANAEETQVTQDFLSATKYKISTDQEESKMLLVTAIRDVADVYEVGYVFTGYTVGSDDIAETTKYYDSLTTGGVTETASDIFGADWADAKLIVWEVSNTANVTFSAYAKVGERVGDVLTKPTDEIIKTSAERTNQKYTVTFVDEYGTTLGTQEVYNGKVPTFADPTKEADAQYTYTFAGWDSVFAPVTGDVTYTANYTETLNKYMITIEDGGNALASMEVDYGTKGSVLNATIPTKNGFNFVKWQVLVGETYIDVTDEMEVTQDWTVKAVWEKEIVYYDVKYFGYNGAEIKAETVEEGEKLTAPEAPNLYNATFMGWYEESLTEEWDFDSDTIGENTKLYAKYSRTDATATEFESFNSELSLLNVKTNSGTVEYCDDEIAGVKGSAKLTLKGGYPEVHVAPRQAAAGYDLIVFKVYVPAPATYPNNNDKNLNTRWLQDKGVGDASNTIVHFDRWIDIAFDATSIMSQGVGDEFVRLFWMINDGNGGVFYYHRFVWSEDMIVYLADVRYAKSNAPADNQILDFAQDGVSANTQYIPDGGDWLRAVVTTKEVNGNTKPKLELLVGENMLGAYPKFYVKTVHDKAYYANLGYEKVVIPVYIPATESNPAGTKMKFSTCRASGGWQDVYLTLGGEWQMLTYSLDDFFDRYSNGKTMLFQIDKSGNKFSGVSVYLGEMTLQKEYNNRNMSLKEDGVIWYANTDNSPQGFRDYTSLVYFDGVYTIKCEMGTGKGPNNNKLYLPIDDNGAVVDVEARKAEWRAAGYTKVQIRCYIPSTNLSQATKDRGSKTILFNADPDMTVYDQKFVPLDQWYTYEMDFDAFWSRYNTTYKLMALFGAYNTDIPSANPAEYCDEDFVIYFDSIRLA